MPSIGVRPRRVPLRAAMLIDAPYQQVCTGARLGATWTRAAAVVGLHLAIAGHSGRETLARGDLLRLGEGTRCRAVAAFQVEAVAPADAPAVELLTLRGAGRHAGWTVTVLAASTPAGVLVTIDVRPGGPHRRGRVLRWAQALLGVIDLAAAGDGAAPIDLDTVAADRPATARPQSVVVAGAIVRDGAVLAARRTYPPELAGRWELPGGKVEAGETETHALARELAEELGITVTVGARVGPDCELAHGVVLRAYLVEIADGEPSPMVHDALRWVTSDGVPALDWAPPDLALVPALRRVLTGRAAAAGHH